MVLCNNAQSDDFTFLLLYDNVVPFEWYYHFVNWNTSHSPEVNTNKVILTQKCYVKKYS